MSLKSLFKEDYKELFEIQRQEVRQLREALRRTENKLARQDQSAVATLMLYGFEAVQRYKDKLEEPAHE